MKKIIFMKILPCALFLCNSMLYAQFQLAGVVRDSVEGFPLPGVSILIKSQNTGTTSDSEGRFIIESKTPQAQVTFSFIGLKTRVEEISDKDESTILMYADPSFPEFKIRYIKATVDVGYFGDTYNAPAGFVWNSSLQSIGKTNFGVNFNLKLSKANENLAFEMMLSKELNTWISHLTLDHKVFKYNEKIMSLEQSRVLLTKELPRFWALDFGLNSNKLKKPDAAQTEDYLSGSIGVNKVFARGSLGNWGFYANVNYHPVQTRYEIGTYKGIAIKNFRPI
ncbi:MAG: carboxypeptidase-like regulatory domain-containing protein, partial [Cytophagales bacterium]